VGGGSQRPVVLLHFNIVCVLMGKIILDFKLIVVNSCNTTNKMPVW
jgi:hypothetical protein